MRTADDLREKQALPLHLKIALTKDRIRQWVNEFGEDGVYVSYSGGKDSTVLLHIVRQLYPNIKAVFCDTGLEYPAVRAFVKDTDNVDFLKPKLTFKQTIIKHGYPVIGKEVAESVAGARVYLREIIDRQTDNTLPILVRKTNRARSVQEKGEYP